MQLAMFRFGSRVPSAWTAMAVIAALGLAVAQGIDGLLTATGLVFLDIALPVPLLGRWGVAVGFALVLQASAITADLMLANAPRLQRASRVLGAVLMAMLIWGAVQATAAFLHFAQLTNLTQGDQLTQALSYDVDLLVQRSAAAFARMRADYTAAVAAQRMLETQSRAGDDQSRIAACGPRCLSAIEVRRQLESRFAVLAATPPAAVPTAPAESASAAYARLAPVIDALRTRSALYAQMCGLLHAPTCPDAAGLVTADPAYLRLQQAMAGDQVANRQ
ncbi:MAG TPA: hypothetical protein VFW75_14275, partial [Acetobacteraceae bacterium]|nr:hypothetical protein [Acetobacteraceae bacterium]